MVLVAISMVAIISIAALSIDVITLYLAREEAQRSADSAALAAAKIISVSGLTGDPTNSAGNWQKICGPDNGVNGLATRVAKSVAGQDTVGGQVATTINVGYSAGTGSGGSMGVGTSDCSTLTGTAFGVNPIITVQITRASLPTFFSRIWGNTGGQVSATATAETYNPSNSANVGNQTSGTMIPVQPRCIKPWAVPNQDPQNQTGCSPTGTPCQQLVNYGDGSLVNPGMTINGSSGPGTVGEMFWLEPDCRNGPANCQLHTGGTLRPQANYSGGTHGKPNLLYVPAQVGTPVLAVPSCTSGEQYEEAIEGCDQPTNYACGSPGNVNMVDLTINPIAGTTAGVSCLIHQADTADFTNASGQDYLTTSGTFGASERVPLPDDGWQRQSYRAERRPNKHQLIDCLAADLRQHQPTREKYRLRCADSSDIRRVPPGLYQCRRSEREHEGHRPERCGMWQWQRRRSCHLRDRQFSRAGPPDHASIKEGEPRSVNFSLLG